MATLDILTAPEDLERVRNLLGVTAWDLTDALIATTEFGWLGEHEVKVRRPTWAADLLDPTKGPLTRVSAAYATASIIADTYARGGTVNLTGEDPPRKWTEVYSTMSSYLERTLVMLDRLDGSQDETTYDYDSLIVKGVSRTGPADYRDVYPPVHRWSSPQTD